MKLSRRLVMIAPFLALVFLTSPAHSQKAHGLAYKSIHLMKLTSSNAEASLLQKLAEANKLYVRLGYPNIRYRVWKISGEQSGTFTHIWESEWPDKAAYDKAHELKELNELFTRYEKEFAELLKDGLSNRYEELPVVPKKK